MGKKDSLFEHVYQYSNLSLDQSIPKVPLVLDEFQKKWPQRSDFRIDKLNKLWTICESKDYQFSETWSLNHHNKILTIFNGLSSLAIGYLFRRHLKLGRAGVGGFNVYVPSAIASVIFSMALHSSVVVAGMSVNPHTTDHTTLIVQSGLLQSFTSILYPIMFSSFSSIYFASKFNTFPVPTDLLLSAESRKYIGQKIFKPFFGKNRKSLALLVAINLMAGCGIGVVESSQIKNIYQTELNKVSKQSEDN